MKNTLVGLLTLDLKYYNYFGCHNCVCLDMLVMAKENKKPRKNVIRGWLFQ